MPIKKKTLYLLLSVACVAGYIWLFINYKSISHKEVADVCIIKHATGIPCPSCGSTRSVVSILNGNFSESLMLNPIGILLFLILVISPMWVLYDIVSKKSSLYSFYIRAESALKQRWVAIFSILLVSANWAWNIYKEL